MQLLSNMQAMKSYGLLIFFLFLITGGGWSQSISISVDKLPLEKVFILIEKQSGYNFIYSTEAMTQSKPVTLQVKDESLSKVLTLCFRDQPLNYTTTDNKHVIVKLKAEEKPVPTSRELRGKVVNENGEGVAGVTIAVKGTKLVSVSDKKGDFIFPEAPLLVTLMISGAEMNAQELYVGNDPFAFVHVKVKVGTLDETMVIAYGKVTRRYATGTVASIKAEEISRQPISNPIAALAGRISGLQIVQRSGVPGALVTVQLRGQNSLANGNDPLYVVDGIPFPSATLNGQFGGGAGIASSPFNNLNASDIESIEVLKDAEATSIYGSRGANGVILITTKKGIQGKTRTSIRFYSGVGAISRRMDLLNTKQYLMMRREAFANDGITPTNSNAKDLLLWDTTRYTDWQEELIGKTMHVTELNTSLSGGSGQTQFLIRGAYRKETTVFPGNFGEEKFSGSMNLVHQSIDKRFSLTFSTLGVHNKNILPRQDLSSQITLSPNAPSIYAADGGLNWENSTWTNPLAGVSNVFRSITDNLITNISMSYRIGRGFELKTTGGYTSITTKENLLTPRSVFDPSFGFGAEAGFGNKSIKTLIAEPQLTYERSIKKARLALLVGSTVQSTHQTALYQVGLGYTSDDLLYSLKSASSILTFGETDILYRYAGVFGRLNFDWDKKWLLTFTMRRDGSSRYGTGNRFANFGSAGVGWIFTDEPFLRNNSFFSFGKLKVTAGTTGNDQIGDYKYLDLYAPGNYRYLGNTTFNPVQLFNPDYGWEQVLKREVRLETGWLKNRILFNAGYYHNTTTNQLVSYSLPLLTGFSGVVKNIPAKIRNNGFEFELNGDLLKAKRWSWSVSMNLTIPKNKLLSFEGLESSSYSNYYVLGQSLFIVKSYGYKEVDPASGKYTFIDYNQDNGISSPADEQAVVNISQTLYGGLQSSIRYGKLNLSVLFQFARQPNQQNYLGRFSSPGYLMNQPTLVLDRWRKPGDVTDIQRFSNSDPDAGYAFYLYRSSNAAYSDASFIRLKNLYLSYNLLNDQLRHAGFSDCQLFVQGQNLLTISRYKGLDPETQSFLPPIRLLSAGVQVTF